MDDRTLTSLRQVLTNQTVLRAAQYPHVSYMLAGAVRLAELTSR